MSYDLIDDETFLITEVSKDPEFGYNPDRPIPIFGIDMEERLQNKRRYLNALLSPSGAEIIYLRIGSFLPFEAELDGVSFGYIDAYQIYWNDMHDHLLLYMNMYCPQKLPLKAPLGLSMRII